MPRTRKPTPTPRERDVLTVIARYHQQHGYAPSIRDVCALLGLRSSGTAYNHFRHLMEKGYLSGEPGSPRTWRVLKLPT